MHSRYVQDAETIVRRHDKGVVGVELPQGLSPRRNSTRKIKLTEGNGTNPKISGELCLAEAGDLTRSGHW